MSDIRMPTPTVPNKPFNTFKILSFDIYGTLIDWETGILTNLKPLTSQIPPLTPYNFSTTDTDPQTRSQLASLFNEVEAATQREKPTLKYSDVLTECYLRLAKQWNIEITASIQNEARSFGDSIKSWPAFPDTVDAMVRLSKFYRIVPLSNVDRDSFAKSRSGPLQGKIPFWRVYTAQDIGSYKPDLRNFEYLLKTVDEADRQEGGDGIEKKDVLHVAQSLFHDHRPAKMMGMSSVWINRQNAGMGGADGVGVVHDRGEVGYGWRYSTLGEFADEVERQLAGRM